MTVNSATSTDRASVILMECKHVDIRYDDPVTIASRMTWCHNCHRFAAIIDIRPVTVSVSKDKNKDKVSKHV